MQLITNNPYRQLGLLVGATAAEQRRQLTRLQRFIEAEQEPDGDFSFPVLGQLQRTIENVSEASSKLTLDSDKMTAALFWFYDGANTDEPAFDYLKEGEIENCSDIWIKLTASGEVTKRNCSAFQNLSTLLLSKTVDSSKIDVNSLEQAISYKLKFLESEHVKDFKTRTTDETFKTTKNQLQLLFLQHVHLEIEKHGGITSFKFLELFSKLEFSAKEEYIKSFVVKPIEQIERMIDEARVKRKANKSDAINVGSALYNQTKNSLSLLKSVLGNSNIKFVSVSDKASDEILQCGIDYFKLYKDTDNDPSQVVMSLFKIANSLACGNIAKQRCEENTNNLKEWIEDKPERDKQKKIEADLNIITSKLERFQNLSDTIANAKDLIDICKPRLLNIKNALGSFDDFYIKVSSAVVGNAQGMLITAVNEAQDGFKNSNPFNSSGIDHYIDSNGNLQFRQNKTVSLSQLSTIINSAFDVTTSMQTMDMDSQLKSKFNQNRAALSSIKSQIYSATNRPAYTSPRSTSSSSSSGCYIATMAYGDYDHPQVLKLRQFRDEVLDKSTFGKLFIKTYYHYSPKLVEKLKCHKKTNILIRKSLNQFIKLIKP